MRRLCAIVLSLAAVAVQATPSGWVLPDQPGAAPAVVQLAAADPLVMQVSGALRARGFAYASWREDRYSPDRLDALLDAGKTVDRSRVALLAAGHDVTSVLDLLVAGKKQDIRGVALHVDDDIDWPSLAVAARWPAMWVTYPSAPAAARASAFELARHARAAGAQVWLQPAVSAAAAFSDPSLAGWLSSLDVTRTRRFEDARVSTYGGDRHDVLVDVLSRVGMRMIADPVIARVIESESGLPADLVLGDRGRLLRVTDAGAVVEFDAGDALRAVYGDGVVDVHIGPAAAQALVHPETGAVVRAMPTSIQLAQGARSVLMLRHADGSYAYLDLHDARGIDAVMASTDAHDRGRVWWVLADRADARGSRLLRITLQPGDPRRGLWWDPSHPGHALDIQPVQGGHSAVFATYDDAGDSRWYLASGRIANDRFVAGQGGLQLMRRDPALSLPKSDPARRGRIAIDFSVNARHPACTSRTAGATQLALLTVEVPGQSRTWCIEPVALPSGLPEADVNGTWFGGANDSGWGLTVVASGEGESRLMSALLYFHDAEGWPRWAMGAARAGSGGAVIAMHDYTQGCRSCAEAIRPSRPLGELRLRSGGWCAEPELRLAADLSMADGAHTFRRNEMSLQRVTQSRCN